MLVRVFSLLVALVVIQRASAQLSITILEPAGLADQFPSGVQAREAAFGYAPYGNSISGSAVHVPGTATNNGCSPFQASSVPGWPSAGAGHGDVIALIDRGGCTFVTKVRNAQQAGANAVIILNNRDGITPYMADDGTGMDITIPAVIINKASRDAILAADGVSMKMTWAVPLSETVDYTLWVTSFHNASDTFIQNFQPVAYSLQKNTNFTPKGLILNGHLWGCDRPPYRCRKQCTNNGRYCAVDPERDLAHGLDGADVVQENLRQACLFKLLQEKGKGLAWWDYRLLFQSQCNTAQATSTEACSFGILQHLFAGITSADVQTCITESGGYGPTGGQNTMLEALMTEAHQSAVVWLPFMVINGVQYRGTVTCVPPYGPTTCGPLTALCASFSDGKFGETPSACKNP